MVKPRPVEQVQEGPEVLERRQPRVVDLVELAVVLVVEDLEQVVPQEAATVAESPQEPEAELEVVQLDLQPQLDEQHLEDPEVS